MAKRKGKGGKRKQRALNVVRKTQQQQLNYARNLERSKTAKHAKWSFAQGIRRAVKGDRNIATNEALRIRYKFANMGRAERSNKVFKQQVRLAQTNQPNVFGEHGQEMTKIFYRATQRLWEEGDPTQRNELIMQSLGVDTMAEAMALVLANNQEALKMAIGAGNDIVDTNDPDFTYTQFSDKNVSPDYIYMVHMI